MRGIKPGFFEDPTLGKVSIEARYLLLCALTAIADGSGRLPLSLRFIQSKCYPYDVLFSSVKLRAWINELRGVNELVEYSNGGVRYIEITRWAERQETTPPILPGSADRGSKILALPKVAPERNRDVRDIADAYVAATGKSKRWKLDEKRRDLIRGKLDKFPVQDLLDAVRGWKYEEWNTGANPDHKVYNDLELLLRDSLHIERFRDAFRHHENTKIIELHGPMNEAPSQGLAERAEALRAVYHRATNEEGRAAPRL